MSPGNPQPAALRTDFGFKLGASLLWRVFLLQAVAALPVALLTPQSDEFIRIKPSAIYILMALTLFISAMVTRPGLLYTLRGDRLGISAVAWRLFNWLLIGYYVAMAVANVAVIFTASVETWVQFKLLVPLSALIILCMIAPRFMRKAA